MKKATTSALLLIFVLFAYSQIEYDYSNYGTPDITSVIYGTPNFGEDNFLVIPKMALKGASSTVPSLSVYHLLPSGNLKLIYTIHLPDNQNSDFSTFGYTVADDGRIAKYPFEKHKGDVIIQQNLTDIFGDTIFAADLGFDEIRPHIQEFIDEDKMWFICQNINPVDTTIVFRDSAGSVLPYFFNDDTITAQTKMRFEHIVLYNLISKQVEWTFPLWEHFRLEDIDPTQFITSGVVSMFPSFHCNSGSTFFDSLGHVFGTPQQIWAISAKASNQILFVGKNSGQILRIENGTNQGDFQYSVEQYLPPDFWSFNLSNQHGLKLKSFDHLDGIANFAIYNNGKAQGFAEGVDFVVDFINQTYIKSWIGKHPDSLASNRLGNIEFFKVTNRKYRFINWGGQTTNNVNFSILDEGGGIIGDYNYTSQYDESFKVTLLHKTHPFIQEIINAMPTTTHNIQTNETSVAETASFYKWGDGDTTTSSSRIGLTDSFRICGIPYGHGIAIESAPSSTAISIINNSNNKINISPNPNSGSFIIEIEPQASDAQFELYSLMGKLVISQLLTRTTTALNLKNLSNGVYVYHILSNNNTAQGKIIVQ